MGFLVGRSAAALRPQLARIERKLDALLAHHGVSLPEDELDDIRALIDAGETIAAIRAYRERTGASLAQAKAAIEQGL